MSEHINNASQRKEALKKVIHRLHAGETVEELQEKFGEVISGATAGEIAEAERALIAEGVSVSEIQRLCDLHVAVFRKGLDEEPEPESLPGHPIYTFRMENEVTMRLLEAMAETLEKWLDGDGKAFESVKNQIDELGLIEKHYARKENILFPYLEKKGFEGPAQVMWGVDNEIRSLIKQLKEEIHRETPDPIEATAIFQDMEDDIREMIYKEEKILFPAAIERLSQAEFSEIRRQADEIGYFNVKPQAIWQPEPQTEVTQPMGTTEKTTIDFSGLIPLATGALTQNQIDLMLTHLPIDVTFLDEHDNVRYFSQGRERIFDRSPAIIGRAVTKCHPPQSVNRVEIILDDFRSGKRDVAEFWIQAGDKFIHIRYFALHDKEANYQGCIEVSQDVTHIRGLQGEKRLLDDAPGYTD
jgi:DUF438 domain-containing protein